MIELQIPYNESVITLQHHLIMRLAFKGFIKGFKGMSIGGLVILILGLIAGYDDGQYINPFVLLGSAFIGFVVILGFPALMIRKRLKKGLKTILKEAGKNKRTSHYTFTDEGMRYSNGIISNEIK